MPETITAAEAKELRSTLKKNSDDVQALTKSFGTFVDKMSKTPSASAAAVKRGAYFNIRQGENPLTSRGLSFIKMFGVLTGDLQPEDAKVEIDIHNKLHQAFVQGPKGNNGYLYGGKGMPGQPGGKFLAPLASNYMHDCYVDEAARQEYREIVTAGVAGADPDNMAWMRQKSMGYKTLSWLNENLGGALVAPPEMGEIIELLRNKEALVNAGARTVPLPPQGRMQYPRQTAASLTFWVGESAPITPSDIGTGLVTLQAKKLAVLVRAPNELIRFASPAAEALIRDDMTKSLALGLDLAGLEGKGSDYTPRGLINYPNINNIASSSPGQNGDKIVPQDVYRMIAIIEESNAEFESFIMRPKTLYKYFQLRADAVGQGDSQGPFMFDLIRELGTGFNTTIAGFPVTKSTQVSQTRSKGTANNLTYILGGMLSDVLIGMFGAIEFSATTQGDTTFINDQTWVKGILSADIQIRHEASIVLMDNLNTTL